MIYWYQEVLKKYAVFSGRAGRSEYWWFTLTNTIVIFLLEIAMGLNQPGRGGTASGAYVAFLALFCIYVFGVLLPSLAVTVRRLHDTGKTGWIVLLNLIPLIGGLIVLVFMIQDSDQGNNKYGPNPRVAIAST
jgi:uncharacterized membrane protein YhaH (DUF805 family)